MSSIEYRRLVSRIMKVHGRRLNLLRVDAAEMAEDVMFGRLTEKRVFELLAHLEDWNIS